MAHNPKLNVYILKLNNQKESVQTFRDLFKEKFNLPLNVEDKDVFETYFQNFLNGLGKKEFKKDIKAKKVIGVIKEDEDIYSIKPHYEKHIIEGVIDGGKYGILREYANIDKKDEKQKLDEKNAVLDKFYFLLNTPLNSKHGILLIQSYTEETIQEPFKDLIKPFFSCENYFFNIIIEPFVPEKFVEKFKKEAKVRLFSYSTIMGLGNEVRNEKNDIGENTFEVTINIKPLTDIKPVKEKLNSILSKLGLKKFDSKNLEDLPQKVFIESGAKKRKAHFNIEKEIASIKPTIYLVDEGINVDKETSLPNFQEIKDFCFGLLVEIYEERYKSREIYEF